MPIRSLPLGGFLWAFWESLLFCGPGVVWFGFVFSFFFFYVCVLFFSSVWEILLRTTTFYILERFQKLADDFCLFVFKEKGMLSD